MNDDAASYGREAALPTEGGEPPIVRRSETAMTREPQPSNHRREDHRRGLA